jgi:NADPH:quinone reductase-like Zn-dependent oxidoreductase
MIKATLTILVALHFAVTAWHGSAHTTLAIGLPPVKNAFVIGVILVAPLVGAALLWTRFLRTGVWVVFLSMVGALVFGAYHHYVLVSPDNIHHLPAGAAQAQAAFVSSAAAVALVELAAALAGAFALGSLRAGVTSGRR